MHKITKAALVAAALAGAATLASCTTGRGGYTGVQVGYNASWGDPYWGWNEDYYYPGTGVYVYTTDRRRVRWNDAQRGYWEGRRGNWRGDRRWRSNWKEFRRRR